MPCLDDSSALAYLEGLLSAERQAEVEQHLAACDDCRWLVSMAGSEAEVDEDPSRAPTRLRSPAPGEETTLAVEAGVARREGKGSLLGQRIGGKYRIERFIGRGGMGTVYEASHEQLARRYAIKVLSEACADNPKAVARLQREAEITSRLAHRHIVEVTDFDHDEQGAPFIVMELLSGESLASRLRREGAIEDLGLVASVVAEATSALQAAHDSGVVHRDLKPSNLFLCDQEGQAPTVKVMDFGISKVLGSSSSLTGDASVIGSPRYMAPEQARGRSADVDTRADIFAMGAIIYEMLTGAPAFGGDTVPDTLYKVVHEQPGFTPRWHGLPEALRAAVLEALSKRPRQRQRSMRELGDAVARALGASDEASRTMIATPAMSPPRRAVVAAAAAAVGMVAAVAIYLGTRSAPDAPARARAPAAVPARAGALPPSDAGSPGDGRARSAPVAVSRRPRKRARAGHRRPRRRPRPPRATKAAKPQGEGALTIQSIDAADGQYQWSDVLLDGRVVGRTPLTLERVRSGRHRLELRRAGYVSIRRVVEVPAGGRRRIRVVLRRR